ncbi:MAG: AlpA family phage regulatory protein [Alphaproteobacteria bacterium]|nr:MAG: AlpA family phage regulatory protein [Alphaproteobacteria bacterium]
MTKSNAATADVDPILSKREVSGWLGVDKSTVDRWTRDGLFPPKVQLGPSRVGWPRSAVQAWLDGRTS